MRSLLVAGIAVLTSMLAAQQPVRIHCGHALTEDGRGWRDDVVITLDGPEIVSIEAAAPGEKTDFDFGDRWVVPGLIDLHTHVCLHPYDEASWSDQVLTESLELRAIRATHHAKVTLEAGFVAIRDLGTEGAGFTDVALRTAIENGIVPGPHVFAATRAIVATGCYGPRLPGVEAPTGAQTVTGADQARAAVREQIAAGADWIKIYTDYARAPGAPTTPTLSLDELHAIGDEAHTAGVPIAAHATTDEGVRRALEAGVRTIEHGTKASDETLRRMQELGVALCPTLAANEAIARYSDHSPASIARLDAAKRTFQRALTFGVTIACGSDAGVFRHGANGRELELMVDYGMTPAQALAAATSVAAKVLGRDDLGTLRKGARPGLVILAGDVLADIHAIRDVRAVVLDDRGPVR